MDSISAHEGKDLARSTHTTEITTSEMEKDQRLPGRHAISSSKLTTKESVVNIAITQIMLVSLAEQKSTSTKNDATHVCNGVIVHQLVRRRAWGGVRRVGWDRCTHGGDRHEQNNDTFRCHVGWQVLRGTLTLSHSHLTEQNRTTVNRTEQKLTTVGCVQLCAASLTALYHAWSGGCGGREPSGLHVSASDRVFWLLHRRKVRQNMMHRDSIQRNKNKLWPTVGRVQWPQ